MLDMMCCQSRSPQVLSQFQTTTVNMSFYQQFSMLYSLVVLICKVTTQEQESPAIADKPTRRESLPKLLQFDVLTTLSLTILAYLHSFSCCSVRNLRNPAKFTKNLNLWSSRSSKVIDLGVKKAHV